ncbi:MAG: Thermitase, partial [Candidatus Falkowbacteria bacterium GW2011_GWA2_39_24]
MAKKIKAYFLLFILLMIVSLFGLPQKSAILAENLATADQETILVKYQDNEDIITVQLNPGQTINQALEVYNTSPLVDYAEPNYLYQAASIPNDPFYNNQWYLKRIIADQAWEIADSSPDIIIAVLDSGLQIEHPDLKNNIWTNDREMPDNGLDDDNNGYI